MPNQETIDIIKSTAPVLQQHGEIITKVFYKQLFENHPEMKNIFNMTNQIKGEQPKALANAIFQYACHIDKLELLNDTVESIAQKHASFSISKDMYPIVGKNLLNAIKLVLGDAATPVIINAWAEAYESLSVIFIKREEQLYVEKENNKGGFRGMKEFVVINKVKESDVITSFYLQRKDNTSIPQFTPGQYISLTIDIPNTTHKHTRNYSLSDTPYKNHLRISVKKEEGTPKGMVSNHLHSTITIGDTLLFGMPSGNFTLKNTENPLVLISGGVGITPLISMYLSTLTHKKRPIHLIQCVKNSNVQAFKNEIAEHANDQTTLTTIYSKPLSADQLTKDYNFKGFLTLEILKELKINPESDFYFCGPKPFMINTISILKLLNVPETNINFEFFGPSIDLV